MKKIIGDHARTDAAILAKFLSLREVMSVSCVVSDAQERQNVMHSAMKMRSIVQSFIGPALTVKLTAGDIVDCLEIFQVAQKGDVVVIDAFGESETSIWGGLMSGLARAAGVVGVVIDGSARDTDEARMLGFPVVSRSVSPRASHSAYSGRFEPIEINTPVVCGGLRVNPGDIVVADEIGVTVVPSADAGEVYERARAQADKEEKTRADILKGLSVKELLAKYGRL
ncbi:MAG: RraA family protein [Spirochaetia bacterium]|jgi:3-hexulose-6-phosphate synthase/6-phospho-3-hexuloisomerase